MNETDMQLLQIWLGDGHEDAFTEIVRRNLPLVYSAALRQVRSAHLAEEIAQSVFSDLAKSARSLNSNTIITAWLYRVARRTAIDVIRRETRRLNRELAAHELNDMDSNTDHWREIEPLLEEAMETLEETDRTAVLLRYFQGKSLREVAEALGGSENAAQKRVARAVERLHAFFRVKGVSISTAGLALVISNNSSTALPAALAATVAQCALSSMTVGTTTLAMPAIKALGMTITQKFFVGVIALVCISTAVYEARKISPKPGRQPQVDNPPPLIGADSKDEVLVRERDVAAAQAAALKAENEKLKRSVSETLKLRDEVTRLRNESKSGATAAGVEAVNSETNSLRYLVGILSDRDDKSTDTMRYNAAQKLRSLGAEAMEALPTFVNLLHSETEATRYAGARALAFISDRSPEAFQQLTNGLSDPDPQVRDAASHGVGLLFNQKASAKDFKDVDILSTLPIVLQNLEDSSRTVRADSIQTLRQYIDGQKWSEGEIRSDVLVPALIPKLSDSYSYVRMNASQALEAIGPGAEAALPQLRQLLADPDGQVRQLAGRAISSIEQKSGKSQ